MAKLKLGAIADDKPVKLTVELSAAVHRDLLAYADYLNSQYVSVALTEGGDAWRSETWPLAEGRSRPHDDQHS
jgi:hypothetical protein